jgi:hypothetical protein
MLLSEISWIRHSATKEPLVDAAPGIARAVGGPAQLRIKREDGTIQDERTYGQDPYPPKG